MSTAGQARTARICVLSFSAVADDPRLRRHCQSLHDAGYEVTACGLTGAQAAPPVWPIHGIAPPAPGLAAKLAIAARLLPTRLLPALDETVYWSQSSHRRLRDAAAGGPYDLYIANDWATLPIAAQLAAGDGTAYLYDTHEYAVAEHIEDWRWRLLFPGHVRRLEQRFIVGAAACSTVCDSIAAALRRDHGLADLPAVIRNLPAYRPTAFRPTGDQITVLYHGLFNPNRGLLPLIESVALWRPGRRLLLRGFGNPGLVERLRAAIARLGLDERVTIEPPVPADAVIEAASNADIGIFALPDSSLQNRFALPNKLFEYVMAGLCVCVSDLPEMAAVVRHHDLGVLLSGSDPRAIAAGINSLERDAIDRYKAKALKAASTLCWERESERWLAVVRCALAKAGPCAASGPRSA